MCPHLLCLLLIYFCSSSTKAISRNTGLSHGDGSYTLALLCGITKLGNKYINAYKYINKYVSTIAEMQITIIPKKTDSTFL